MLFKNGIYSVKIYSLCFSCTIDHTEHTAHSQISYNAEGDGWVSLRYYSSCKIKKVSILKFSIIIATYEGLGVKNDNFKRYEISHKPSSPTSEKSGLSKSINNWNIGDLKLNHIHHINMQPKILLNKLTVREVI